MENNAFRGQAIALQFVQYLLSMTQKDIVYNNCMVTKQLLNNAQNRFGVDSEILSRY